MVDDLNRTFVVFAVLGVVATIAVGIWLTNLGAGSGGQAAGSADPADWASAANAICSDTNAEVVDLDQSLGDDAEPAVVIGRAAQVLARRADGLAALPEPSGVSATLDALIVEMRDVHSLMLRIQAAMERGESEQAEQLAVGPENETLTALSYELGVPWCDLFGADDATIRNAASFNVLQMQDLLELHRQDAGTYAGADLTVLRERYGSDLVQGEVLINRASTTSYCVESTVGYLTLHAEGPNTAELSAGRC
ncbi:MAG: hypothetical protein ACR2OD_13115 [Gaiellaceae bacterium]